MISIILSMIEDQDDEDYLTELFEKYDKKLFLKAMDITNCREDSEECVLDVIMAVSECLEKVKSLNEDQQLLYIMKCCQNIAIDKYRKNKNRIEHEHYGDELFDFCVDDEENQIDVIISEENCKNILGIIDKMSPKLRDVLYFRCVANMECSEIAKMLSISTQQVYVRLYRARQTLMKKQGEKINEILRK